MKNILIALVVLGGGSLLLRNMKPGTSEELVHYPRDLAEVKKLGGFWKLSPEQQAYVRFRYVDELRVLLERVNERMQLAQFSGDLASCYQYRTLIRRLQDSMQRVQRPSVDPTGEQQVIMNVSIFLSR
jgi:hypothetical protein